jgi:hypothetical protein
VISLCPADYYAYANPVRRRDPLGLQAIPGYDPPDNTQAAAGWFDGDLMDVCTVWYCPRSYTECSRDDIRKPTDFIPAAYDRMDPPKGCKCIKWVLRNVPKSTLSSDDVIRIGGNLIGK